jgi:hypothetical protein
MIVARQGPALLASRGAEGEARRGPDGVAGSLFAAAWWHFGAAIAVRRAPSRLGVGGTA